MASWLPMTNGYQGIVQEREDRWYILWDGYLDGEIETKRFRVNERTRANILEELQEDDL